MTKEALIADRRAFVFPIGLNQFWERDPKTGQYNWRLRPGLLNTGETPTRRLRFYVDCEFRNSPLPENFQFIDGPARPGKGFLGPKATLYGGLAPQLQNAALSPQDLHDIINGRKYVYLWGWIRYFDVFPGTPEHITRFCWQILVTGDPFKFVPGQVPQQDPDNLNFSYLQTAQGNCADEECFRK